MFNKSRLNSLGLALFCASLFCAAPLFGQETVNQQVMKTDLLVVTAHPDDESMMAATMARYADRGKTVSIVICTHGEGGGNGTGKELGVALGVVREGELRRCLGVLGTRYLYFLNQPDWAYTESVQATLAKWGKDESLRRLVRLVRIMRPEVVCTMDPAPVGGQHGHHQAAGRLATEAFAAAADPRAFPEQIEEEGLAVWKVRKLYWVSFGGGGNTVIRTDEEAQGVLATSTSRRNRYADIAARAEMNHRSQGFDKFMEAMANSGQSMFARPNNFLLVKSRVPVASSEKDLFEGIEGANIAEGDLLAAQHPAPETAAVVARVQPIQPVQNYQDWLKANHISHLMKRLPAHVPVTMGIPSPVTVLVTNTTNAPRTEKTSIVLPYGWKADSTSKQVSLQPRQTQKVVFQVTSTTDKQGSYTIKARAGESQDTGEMDALPLAVAPRLSRSFAVDADIRKWEAAGFRAVAIPHTYGAQGTGKDDSEISGRFFMGYTQEGMHVLVDVKDDTVVFNIAPDDIKGHWRSTSTEIAIDPNPRSENTFGTLKLGIFPQDTTGRVRAGRDADANPGPVDKKEPSIRLASKTTAGGYIVEALIPWKTLRSPGFAPVSGRKIGFNVILFHAMKKQARVGEDINKSRLAWSYWSGVWGRPIVWGTVILK